MSQMDELGWGTLHTELEQVLRENILQFWIEHAEDPVNGGFVGEMDSAMNVRDVDKGLVLDARILWTFAAAYHRYGDGVYAKMAERAYAELTQHFLDEESGGYYWSVSPTGKPAEDKKQVYGQVFVIYALAEWHRATGSQEALTAAIDIYQLIERHAYDPVYRGYVEALGKEWTYLEEVSLSGTDLNERKSMNTHLHVLEAYTNLYRVWPDAGLLVRLKELIDVMLECVTNKETNHFHLYFGEDWQVKSNIISYGHDIEGSWLLYEAAEVIGDQELLERVRSAALAMAEAVYSDALEPNGTLLYERDGDHIDREQHWWPLAEAMVGFYNAYELTGETRFAEAVHRIWSFTSRYVIDQEQGEWHWKVSQDGIPDPAMPKISSWKCPYHNGRMCLELLERIARHIKADR
jgi:mannobiose 2-epimerase